MTHTTQTDKVLEDQELGTLLSDAGQRPEPSKLATEQAYATLKSEWVEQVQIHNTQRQKKWLVSLSAAASVALVAMITLFNVTDDSSNGAWGVQVASGALTINGQSIAVNEDVQIHATDLLSTSSAVRLETAQGVDLRLAANSEIQWSTETSIALSQGEIYIDTREQADFLVDTRFGNVRDIGTRFMVSVENDALVVAVREGIAEVQSEFGLDTAAATTNTAALVRVDAAGRAVSEERTTNPRWDWIHEAPAGYVDRALPAVLKQIARDLGKSVEFRSHGVAAIVANDTVQGDLIGLAPHQALDLVTHSADLSWQEGADAITIDFIR